MYLTVLISRVPRSFGGFKFKKRGVDEFDLLESLEILYSIAGLTKKKEFSLVTTTHWR